MPKTSIVAEPPAQGIRVERSAAGDTSIIVVDHGARGYPWHALVVVVDEIDRRLQVSGDPDVPLPDRLFAASAQASVGAKEAPYDLRVAAPDWPANGTQLLVVLLYFDVIERGQAADTPRALALKKQTALPRDDPNWPLVSDAVKRLLDENSADALRAGLIADTRATRSRQKSSQATTFALMSCQYPCDILDHMPAGENDARGPADASLLRLGDLLAGRDGGEDIPTLLLMAGDQIYVDATAGLFDPKSQDDKYRIPYQTLFASRGPQSVLGQRNVELRMMLDDHEISDNWEPGDEPNIFNAGASSPSRRGVDAYWRYQRAASPRPDQPLYDAFEHRGLCFFLADTRTERQARTASTFREKRIMSTAQFDALTTWMADPAIATRPKFILTSSMLLPRRLASAEGHQGSRALHSDAWDGYPRSLHALLKHVCDKQIERLVFLPVRGRARGMRCDDHGTAPARRPVGDLSISPLPGALRPLSIRELGRGGLQVPRQVRLPRRRVRRLLPMHGRCRVPSPGRRLRDRDGARRRKP